MSHRGSFSSGDLVFQLGDQKTINKQTPLHFISCIPPKNKNNSSLDLRSAQTMQEEEGGECSSFKQGDCFLEFSLARSISLPGGELFQEQNHPLQNLRASEPFEVLEIHYISSESKLCHHS